MTLKSSEHFWHRWCLRWGVGGVGRALRASARAAGVDLAWSGGTLRLRDRDGDILLPAADAWGLFALLPVLPTFKSRLHYEPAAGGRPTADLRGVQRYRQWADDDWLWQPVIPETVDSIPGYFARGRPAPGATAFDIGAYVGEVTLPLARLVGPTGRVFAFECGTRALPCLERNVRESGPGNITVVPSGLWKERGELTFSSARQDSSCVASIDSPESYTARVITFEDACALACGAPDFVKMDIEGAEIEVIGSSLEFIRRHRIRFAIASYHVRDGRPTAVALEAMFASIGYAAETGNPVHPTTWAWPAG